MLLIVRRPGVQQTLTVPSTGSLWEPLDDWVRATVPFSGAGNDTIPDREVLQSFATAIRIRVPGGTQQASIWTSCRNALPISGSFSRLLLLERPGRCPGFCKPGK